MIKGISASRGIAIAKAYRLEEIKLDIDKREIDDVNEELMKLEKAIKEAEDELIYLRDLTLERLGKDEAEVFAAHLLILNDPELMGQVIDKIKKEKINAEYSLKTIRDMFISIFENMDNEYMRERAVDIYDVTNRILAKILNIKTNDLSLIKDEVIIVSHDLTPSDTAQMNKKFVKGIVTNIGGKTSHAAIIARSLEIPAVVGTKNALEIVEDGMLLIIDGFKGEVIVNPSEEEINKYQKMMIEIEYKQNELLILKDQMTVTKDGKKVKLMANISSLNDLQSVINNGAEGIGLFRTEFLYMDKDQLPTEEQQFQAYKQVLVKMVGKPVVIRTLDIGGYKNLPYLNLPKELNPFLGYRAIRFCLGRKDIFRTQLRALLRASIYGNLKIMFPMIATIDEFIEAKEFLLAIKKELLDENIEVNEDIKIGMMIEVPSAALFIEKYAKFVDFFSIGTNDLVQYLFACDRMNEHVYYLYQPFNPVFLRLIKNIIDVAHQENKEVGMCGEMAGDEMAIPLLLGFGLDEFSMSATNILQARNIIRKLSLNEMSSLAYECINKNNMEEVISFIKKKLF